MFCDVYFVDLTQKKKRKSFISILKICEIVEVNIYIWKSNSTPNKGLETKLYFTVCKSDTKRVSIYIFVSSYYIVSIAMHIDIFTCTKVLSFHLQG